MEEKGRGFLHKRHVEDGGRLRHLRHPMHQQALWAACVHYGSFKRSDAESHADNAQFFPPVVRALVSFVQGDFHHVSLTLHPHGNDRVLPVDDDVTRQHSVPSPFIRSKRCPPTSVGQVPGTKSRHRRPQIICVWLHADAPKHQAGCRLARATMNVIGNHNA